jgi:TRAP-type C4-dicarboxylate transport system permease small subunit
MAIFGFILVIFGVIAWLSSNYMYKKIKDRTTSFKLVYDHSGKTHYIIFGIMILITLLSIIFTFITMPSSPNDPPFFHIKVTQHDPFEINDFLINKSEMFEIEKI